MLATLYTDIHALFVDMREKERDRWTERKGERKRMREGERDLVGNTSEIGFFFGGGGGGGKGWFSRG